MTTSKSTTKPKQSKSATRRRTRKISQPTLDAYGDGCAAGHHQALTWLRDRQRTLPAVYCAGLQHVMLDLMDDHHKARGTKRAFVRGQVVGFFSTLENPSLAAQLEQLRINENAEAARNG